MCVFGVLLGVFWCLEERKKRREKLGRREISEKYVLPRSRACLGLFIALGVLFEATAIVGPPPAFQWPPALNPL